MSAQINPTGVRVTHADLCELIGAAKEFVAHYEEDQPVLIMLSEATVARLKEAIEYAEIAESDAPS